MRALVLSDETLNSLKSLRVHAENNPISKREMSKIMEGKALPVGERDGFHCHVPIGYKVAYSIEQHPKQRFRHASFSIDALGKTPDPVAVEELMGHLGFTRKLMGCHVEVEAGYAINVLEPLDE